MTDGPTRVQRVSLVSLTQYEVYMAGGYSGEWESSTRQAPTFANQDLTLTMYVQELVGLEPGQLAV